MLITSDRTKDAFDETLFFLKPFKGRRRKQGGENDSLESKVVIVEIERERERRIRRNGFDKKPDWDRSRSIILRQKREGDEARREEERSSSIIEDIGRNETYIERQTIGRNN